METKLGPALEFERRSVRIDKRKGASRSILSEECSGASQSLLRHAERVYPTKRPAPKLVFKRKQAHSVNSIE
jgi:hypothetical protein